MYKFIQQILITLFVVTSLVIQLPARSADAPVITLGVVPQQAANVLANLWVPLTQYLSEETGLTVRFATASSIPKFEQRLSELAYDIAYMNPYHYVYYSENYEYEAIAKQADKYIKGILVTRKDSEINELTDLQGVTIAFPAPGAFAASILPRAELNLHEINFTPRYVSSHDSVYLNVAKGCFVAGGGVMRTFNNMPESVRNQLNIFWTTQPYTPHAFAVSPKVSVEDKVAIQKALEKLHTTDKGKAILTNLGMQQIATAHHTDWHDVRALNISKDFVKQ